MGKLLKEAALDDKFNVQMKKVQDAIPKLNDILDEMKQPSSMTRPVSSQLMALRYAAEDLKKLWEKAQ